MQNLSGLRHKLLITGGTGFIGRSLIPKLLQQQTKITLLRHEIESGQPFPSPLSALREQFDVVYADLRNFQLTVQAVRDAEPDVVIHLAAAGATDPFLSVNTAVRHNITGTLNLLRACFEKTKSTQQIIIARTPGELTAMNTYAASKAAAWKFCEMYGRIHGWPIHGAMIFQSYGPHQPPHTLITAAIKAALAGQDLPMTAGTQKRDWIYLDDVAAGFAAIIGAQLKPGTTIELGTGQLTSVATVVRQIYTLVNREGKPQIGILPSRPGEDTAQVADVIRTKNLVGWESAVTLQQGLARLINIITP